MKLADLQKKIAEILGVSSSQRELAFEIFIEKIGEILLDQLTLKVPRIGYFQLKADWNKEGMRPLIFSPFSEDFTKDAKNFYLTIDTSQKIKSSSESDSSIFSIGVGKPLLPLTSDEMPDTETSYAMIRKSIEERVKEILTESDQIPNFNIWDDYYNSPEFYESESPERMRSQLDELTSDLKFSGEIIPDKIPDNILEVLDFSFDKENKNDPPPEPEIKFSDPVRKENEEDYTLIGNEKFVMPADDEDFGEEEEAENPEDSGTGEEVTPEPVKEAGTAVNEIETPNTEIPEDTYEGAEIIRDAIEELKEKETVEQEKNETPVKIEEENFYPELLPEDTSPPLTFEENETLSQPSDNLLNEANDAESGNFTAEGIETPSKPDEILTLAQLLDDLPSDSEKTEAPETDIENQSATVPAEEVVEKILKEESEQIGENSEDIPEDSALSAFEELHKITSDEVESSKENFAEEDLKFEAEALPENILEEEKENDEIPQESLIDKEEERIEWNWGDELREEFGITSEEVDAKYEMMAAEETDLKNEIEFVDDYLDDEKIKKDLFSQLEKTLEREIRGADLKPERKNGESRREEFTSERDTLKKVILEFSAPPSKYEFVEERPGAKEKRMAITLMNDTSSSRITGRPATAADQPEAEIKKGLSKKFYFITGGTALFIVLLIASIFYFNKKTPNNDLSQKTQNTADNAAGSQTTADNSSQQGLQNSKLSSETVSDEMNDFPRTATAPVPIKDATDKQILETIKKESAKIDNSKKTTKAQPAKGNKTNAENKNNDLYQTSTGETKINNRIFYDGKNYSLQISSWPSRTRAEDEVKRLRGLGFNAFIIEANLPQKGGKWFRVRVGPFRSEKETNDFMKSNNF